MSSDFKNYIPAHLDLRYTKFPPVKSPQRITPPPPIPENPLLRARTSGTSEETQQGEA